MHSDAGDPESAIPAEFVIGGLRSSCHMLRQAEPASSPSCDCPCSSDYDGRKSDKSQNSDWQFPGRSSLRFSLGLCPTRTIDRRCEAPRFKCTRENRNNLHDTKVSDVTALMIGVSRPAARSLTGIARLVDRLIQPPQIRTHYKHHRWYLGANAATVARLGVKRVSPGRWHNTGVLRLFNREATALVHSRWLDVCAATHDSCLVFSGDLQTVSSRTRWSRRPTWEPQEGNCP